MQTGSLGFLSSKKIVGDNRQRVEERERLDVIDIERERTVSIFKRKVPYRVAVCSVFGSVTILVGGALILWYVLTL